MTKHQSNTKRAKLGETNPRLESEHLRALIRMQIAAEALLTASHNWDGDVIHRDTRKLAKRTLAKIDKLLAGVF